MEDEEIAGIPRAALGRLARRLKAAASPYLPSSEQKIHVVEFVRAHIIVRGEECGDVIEKRGLALGLFGYLSERVIASPDILKEVFQELFAD